MANPVESSQNPVVDQLSFFQTAPLLPIEKVFTFLGDSQKVDLGRTCKWAYNALSNCKLTVLGAFFELPVVKKLFQSCSEPRPALSNPNIIAKVYKATDNARALVKMLQAPQSTEECLREEAGKPLPPLPAYLQALAIGRSTEAKCISKKSLDKILTIAGHLRYNDWCIFSAASSLSKSCQWSKQFPWRQLPSEIFDKETRLWLSLVDCLSDEEWGSITKTASGALSTTEPRWLDGEIVAKELFPQLMQSPLQAAVFFTQFAEESLQIDMTDGEDFKAFMEFFSTPEAGKLVNMKNLGFYSPLVQEYRVALKEQRPLPPDVQKYERLLENVNSYLEYEDPSDPRYAFLFKLKQEIRARYV
jgi:hypothetical protein